MILASLSLQNFRSYGKSAFYFSPQITIFLGPNTSGKTNLLEAIYLMAVGRSFRAEKDAEALQWGSEIARINIKYQSFDPLRQSFSEASKLRIDPERRTSAELSRMPRTGQISQPKAGQPWAENIKNKAIDEEALEIVLTGGQVGGQKTPIKRFLVNEVPKRLTDFLGRLRAVLFWPEDLELVINSPTRRRRYLDFVLVQIDWEYRRSLSSYERGVRQRNKVLERIRKGEATHSQLTFWDQLLIKDGNYLTRKREDFIEAINLSSKPFGDNSLHYDSSIISESRLQQYADSEVAAAVTLVGPHRDDFQFFEKKRDLAKFGSRGEQRLAVLWLKLAELVYIKGTTGEQPILLLDDIFSELDHAHRDEVVQAVNKQQTILTTTDIHFLPEALLKDAEVIELTNA